jgi:hypothetical protein
MVYPRKLSISQSGRKGQPLNGSGFQSRSGRSWNNNRTPIDPRVPPASGQRAGKFSGNIRGGQKGFADQGEGFSGNIRGGRKIFSDQGEGFSGTIKGARRPLKGGGSISGRLWNNNRTAIDPRVPPASAQRAGKFSGNIRGGQKGFADQGEGFSGTIKGARRPLKGGGSVSGRLWNNNRTPIDPRVPPASAQRAGKFSGNIRGGQKGFADQGEGFSGTIKGPRRPLKGGGSISGKLWNNKGEPIDVVEAGKGTQRASQFQGNIKRDRPAKGGGSISGKLWNNNEEPILVRVPGSADAKEANYSGKMKIRRGYTQNPNADKESIKKQRPDKTTYEVAGLQVKVKRDRYEKKPEAAKGSLPGLAPTRSSVKASEYAKGVKIIWNVKHNPNSVKEALAGRQPGKKWERGVEHAGSMKLRYPYRHNPNSADEALKVVYLGKAYARIEDYQGNIKMKKFNNRDFHPDSKFAHGFRNNVKEERTFMMNLKLKWAKLFQKSDTQPSNLKNKERKPRYDRGEQGLWND